MLDLSRLTVEQRQAVLAGDGPLLIVAGPGSGKTTALAARIAYLVTGRQVAPASVLGITFTTRAARELRARLNDMLGEAGRDIDVTTFHAFGLRIVRQWSEELGFPPGPIAVRSAEESQSALQGLAEELGIDTEQWPLADLIRDLERFRLTGETTGVLTDQLTELAGSYEAMLRRRGAIDYPAMLALPLRLFGERPHILRMCQDAYRHILSDEFQDVCAIQYALLRTLAERHRNLAVVGDPCQTLYGWRGADVRFLLDFQRDFPEATIIGLDRNFRSTAHVVDLANALGADLPYRRPLWTSNPPGDLALLHIAPDEQAEARFIATEIERLRLAHNISHAGEVAVLYRTNQQAHSLTVALRERRIPYRVRGNGDLFARREVRDVVAYLRLAHNPHDAPALARIVNTPPRRLARLADDLRVHPVPAEHLVAVAQRYGSATAAGAAALVAFLQDFHVQSTGRRPAELLDIALQGTGYQAWLAGHADGADRMDHLRMLRSLAEQADADLGAWLAELQLGEDGGPTRDDAQSVVLSTIHGAKGGEWRVVFVAGVEEGLLPHWRPQVPRPTEAAGLEDELRVAYVAVTRPRERLYLTLCRTRQRGNRTTPRRPSRFLRGLPVDLVERAA